jgi:hypothetical protein
VHAAHTETTILPTSVQLVPIPGSQPQRFQLADSVTVTITLDPSKTVVASWVASMPQSQQDQLLRHEQGHYDLTALLGRDFFLEVMSLKAKTYAGLPDFTLDRNALGTRFLGKVQALQSKYDGDTANGTNLVKQSTWNGFIQTAFTVPRFPRVQAANGIPLKQPILEVLQTAGISI